MSRLEGHNIQIPYTGKDPIKDRGVYKLDTLPDSDIADPNTISFGERNDNFSRAFNAVVENPDLKKRFVLATKNRKGSADIVNFISVACVSLTDQQIDRIVEVFITSIRKDIVRYTRDLDLDNDTQDIFIQGGPRDPRTGRVGSLLATNGIKSFAHFVRARKKMHGASPETVPVFYLDNVLDSYHGIDLMEVLDTESGLILNLIQIKSTGYSEGEIDTYHDMHRKWINGQAVDLDEYERTMVDQPEDYEQISGFMNDVNFVQEAFLDFITGDDTSIQKLLKFLKIDDKNRAQRVWILKEYSSLLREHANTLLREGLADNTDCEKILQALDSLDKEVKNVLDKKKNLVGIHSVYSICAVGPREVSKKKVFSADKKGMKTAVVD